jgi:hypothetical protein
VILALAVGAWLLRRTPPAPAPGPAGESPARSARESYERALQLALDGHPTESLPYFRAAELGMRGDFAGIHLNYATALYNAGFQTRGSIPATPMTRSSVERVGLVRAALEEMDRGAALDSSSSLQGRRLREEGEWMQAWGFNWEALVRFRGAERANPASREEAAHTRAFMDLMRHPDRPTPEAVPPAPDPGDAARPGASRRRGRRAPGLRLDARRRAG